MIVCPYCEEELDDQFLYEELDYRDVETFEVECPKCKKELHIQVFIETNFYLDEKYHDTDGI
jgi:uncharacterized protein (UPF0212 family)